MGLDMYLKASKHASGYKFDSEADKKLFNDIIALTGMRFDPETPSLTVNVTVAYWRKANAIHRWFVDNVQDGEDNCQRSYVGREQLVALVDTCKQVMGASLENRKAVASDILPPQGGFFFGSTEIDDGYEQDLQYTIEALNGILADKSLEGCDFYYRASW